MKKVITFGGIMLRLSPPGKLRFSQADSFEVIYGGGESNVAVSLANYGVPVEFVTRLPDNDIGRCAMMEMRKRGVGTQHIAWGGERLGIYFLEAGAVSRGSKVIYDRAPSAISEIDKGTIDWENVFEGVGWFHWTGIIPTGGVTAEEENLRGWFEAGATCVGMGSKLVTKELLCIIIFGPIYFHYEPAYQKIPIELIGNKCEINFRKASIQKTKNHDIY